MTGIWKEYDKLNLGVNVFPVSQLKKNPLRAEIGLSLTEGSWGLVPHTSVFLCGQNTVNLVDMEFKLTDLLDLEQSQRRQELGENIFTLLKPHTQPHIGSNQSAYKALGHCKQNVVTTSIIRFI